MSKAKLVKLVRVGERVQREGGHGEGRHGGAGPGGQHRKPAATAVVYNSACNTRVHEDLYTESANKVAMEKATALEVSLEVSGDPDDDVSHTQSPDEPADDADEDEADM